MFVAQIRYYPVFKPSRGIIVPKSAEIGNARLSGPVGPTKHREEPIISILEQKPKYQSVSYPEKTATARRNGASNDISPGLCPSRNGNGTVPV